MDVVSCLNSPTNYKSIQKWLIVLEKPVSEIGEKESVNTPFPQSRKEGAAARNYLTYNPLRL